MALYNMYALEYHIDPYYPVENYQYSMPVDPTPPFLGSDHITGPEQLCPNQTGHYNILHNYQPSTLSEISWNSSSNITVISPHNEETDLKVNSNSSPSYIEARFNETRSITQFFDGEPGVIDSVPAPGVQDVCEFIYRKAIITNVPDYIIDSEFKFCAGTEYAEAIGPDLPDNMFHWQFIDLKSGTTLTATGKSVSVPVTFSLPEFVVRIILTVSTDCGSKEFANFGPYYNCQELGTTVPNGLIVFPNPARDNLTLVITNENSVIPNEGALVRIYNSNTSVLVKSQNVYSRIENLNIDALQDGSYILQVHSISTGDLSTTFIVQRNQ